MYDVTGIPVVRWYIQLNGYAHGTLATNVEGTYFHPQHHHHLASSPPFLTSLSPSSL